MIGTIFSAPPPMSQARLKALKYNVDLARSRGSNPEQITAYLDSQKVDPSQRGLFGIAPPSPAAGPGSRLPGLAARGVVEGIGSNFFGGLEQAAQYNPLSPSGMMHSAQAVGRAVGIPQPPAPPAVLPGMTEQLTQRMGLPQPQGMGEQAVVSAIRGGVGAAPYAMVGGGPGAVRSFGQRAGTAVVSGAAADLGGTGGGAIINRLPIPDWAKEKLTAAASAAAGLLAGSAMNRISSPPAERAANRVRGITEPEGLTTRTMTKPNTSGLEVLASEIEQPLAKALKVEPGDAGKRVATLDAEIARHNKEFYGPAVGTSRQPVMVKLSPRLASLLENEDFRRVVKASQNFLNQGMEGGDPATSQLRRPSEAIYDNAGRLSLDAQTKGIPLDVLDHARRNFAQLVEEQGQTTGMARTHRRDVETKTAALRTEVDRQLKASGDTRLIDARAKTSLLEQERARLVEGQEFLRSAAEDVRGEKVVKSPAVIRAELRTMPPNEQRAFREGVLTAAKEALLTQGMSPDMMNKLVAALPEGTSPEAFVKAWRRSMVAAEIGSEAGTRRPIHQGEISKSELGQIELASNITRRGVAHLLQGILHGPMTPEQQTVVQRFLVSPEGVKLFGEGAISADATRVRRGAATASGTAPARRQTER